MATRTLEFASDGTPDALIPRMNGNPAANARYVRTAVITRINEPLADEPEPWEQPTDLDFTAQNVAFGPRVDVGCVVAPDGSVWVWNPATQISQYLDTTGSEATGMLAVGATRIAVGYPTMVKVFAIDASGSVIAENTVSTDAPVNALAFNAEDSLLVAGCSDGSLVMFDLSSDSEQPAGQPIFLPSGTSITALESDPANNLVIVGGEAGEVCYWDPALGYLGTSIADCGCAVTAIVRSPVGDVLAVAAADGSLRTWSSPDRSGVFSGEHVVSNPFSTRISALAISPDGSWLAVCGVNGADDTVEYSMEIQDVVSLGSVSGTWLNREAGFVSFYPDGSGVVVNDGVGITRELRRWSSEIASAVSLPVPGDAGAGARPAEGVLLTHEQSFVMERIALGELLHSVCLAPGEITQIAVTSHSQSVFERSSDALVAADNLVQQGTSNSDLTETQQAWVAEQTSGGSTAASSSTSSQAGASLFFSSAGTSSTTTGAVQASFSLGNRDVAEDTNQAVHQAAHQQAHQARQQYAASVREVSESDSLEISTRVVANYNHMHALTLQYYEVVQVQSLRTRVTDAHRLLFVPMQLIDFCADEQFDSVIARFHRPLLETLQGLGLSSAALALELHVLSPALVDQRVSALKTRKTNLDTAIAGCELAIESFSQYLASDQQRVWRARDSLRDKGGDSGLAHDGALQDELQQAVDAMNRVSAQLSTTQSKAADLRRQRDDVDALIKRNSAQVDPKDESDPATKRRADLQRVLNEHRLAVNQGLWTRLDPPAVAILLDGFCYDDNALSGTIDPVPAAIAGTYLGFRWNFRPEQHDEAEQFRNQFVGLEEFPAFVALPTGGVFAEGVLGESPSAERIDSSRFWNWNDALPPIRPTEIGTQGAPDDDTLTAPNLAATPAPTINLLPLTFPQVASGIPGLVGVATDQEGFRDMSASKATAALAKAALAHSSQGSADAAKHATDSFKRFLDFQSKVADAAISQSGTNGLDPTLAGAKFNSLHQAPMPDTEQTEQTEQTDPTEPSDPNEPPTGIDETPPGSTADSAEPSEVIPDAPTLVLNAGMTWRAVTADTKTRGRGPGLKAAFLADDKEGFHATEVTLPVGFELYKFTQAANHVPGGIEDPKYHSFTEWWSPTEPYGEVDNGLAGVLKFAKDMGVTPTDYVRIIAAVNEAWGNAMDVILQARLTGPVVAIWGQAAGQLNQYKTQVDGKDTLVARKRKLPGRVFQLWIPNLSADYIEFVSLRTPAQVSQALGVTQ